MCVRVFVCVCSLDSVGVLFGAVICCLFSLYHHDQITFSACALLFGVLCRFSLFFSRMYSLARVPLLLGCFQTPEANACVTCTSAQCMYERTKNPLERKDCCESNLLEFCGFCSVCEGFGHNTSETIY